MGQKRLIKFALNGYLIKIFSLNLISLYFGMHGLPIVGSIIGLFQEICVFIILLYFLAHRNQLQNNRESKAFIIIFLIYWLYCFYYIYRNPGFAFYNMSYLSDSWYRFWLDSFSLVIPVLLCNFFYKLSDFKLVSKYVVIIISSFFVFYFSQIDPSDYISFRSSSYLSEQGLIDGFAVDAYAGSVILLSLLLKGTWSTNHLLNNVIFWVLFLINIIAMLIVNERGPVLFLFFTIFFYYYLKNRVKYKFYLLLLFIFIFVFVFFDRVTSILYAIAPALFERFTNLSVDYGSGRVGDEESAYSEAIAQISSGPLLGTYPRILNPYARSYGMYPHNFFLELLMTFGIIFTTIFSYYLYQIFSKARFIIQNNHKLIFILAIATFTFLSLQSSSTIYMNGRFWLSFAILTNLYLQNK